MGVYSRSVPPQTEHAKAEEGSVEGGGQGDWIGEGERFGIGYFRWSYNYSLMYRTMLAVLCVAAS